MDEMQTTNAKNTEAVSSAKVEITAARKELQSLNLELQGLAAAVSVRLTKLCTFGTKMKNVMLAKAMKRSAIESTNKHEEGILRAVQIVKVLNSSRSLEKQGLSAM